MAKGFGHNGRRGRRAPLVPPAMPSVPVSNGVPWLADWQRLSVGYELKARRQPASEIALRQELVFCLLGGHGVTYELARSATDVVMALCPFESFWTEDDLADAVETELRTPKFDPRRRDGSLRRYRYPRRKAALVTAAVDWVDREGRLREQLLRRDAEVERRQWLCSCPGIGPKSASWLLRNCGVAHELAILDVHILRAMQQAGRLGEVTLPRDYGIVESNFRRWCGELGASVSALDLFLWEWQRGDISPTGTVG